MNLISGVLKEDYSDYVLYFVESLSDELKQEIRSRLSAVCHGVDQAQSAAKIYSYKETAKEFVKRYKSDKNASEKRKKGMIGELLVHIILEIEGRFTTASPFFNMEERSFKKGYDVALFEEKTNELWIAEVKSGEIQKNQKDASAAATGLINTAKNDLKVRLNDYNTSLWLNALNAAKVTMSDSSSTLLSGVNLPAERMFILDNRRGRSNLSHDSFKNLVGRVCRFNEIFNNDSGTLQRLEPQIYLVFGRYFARNANCENFLCNVAKAEKKYQDEVENVLLSQTKITEVNKEELRHASEFIENYENGAVENYKERYIDTTFGKACIMNGANEIDVFKYENEIQQQVSKYQHENLKINDSTKLLEIINELFIKYLPENGTDSLRRLSNKEARKFYAMMFEWRVENKSYSEMISLFFGYWHQLYRKNRNVMVYVGKWGDVKQEGSNVARYTKFIGKNRTQVVNLAIVRIKEEQDFMDNMLIKYVEVLHDLDLIENRFYSRIKYGTDDESAICLIKNGLSLSSATLLIKKYSDYLQINLLESTVTYDENIILKMNENQ